MPCRGPATPESKLPGLGCCAFARRYLRNHCCFLFLRVLRCFTSPGLASPAYFIQPEMSGRCPRRIAPFGHLGINACLPLPQAFRSLPRPSSPCGAKASTVRPFALDRVSKNFVPEPRTRFSLLMSLNFVFSSSVVKEQKSSFRGNRFLFSPSRGARQLVGVTGVEPVTFTLSV